MPGFQRRRVSELSRFVEMALGYPVTFSQQIPAGLLFKNAPNRCKMRDLCSFIIRGRMRSEGGEIWT